jgi:glycosyltransferase involved in cell wall biosynthesis
MKQSPIISVIIPSYNNEKHIIECLNSILEQTFNNFEVIIVNDGSTDDSEKLLKNYIEQKNTNSIYLINQKNMGVSSARNKGASVAKGNFLVFIDADDKIEKTYFEHAISYIKLKKYEIVYSKSFFFEAKKGEWKLPNFKLEKFLIQNCIPIFAFVKNETFKKVGGFDENLKHTEDWDLWIRILKIYPNSVYRIPKFLYFYRKHHHGVSAISLNNKNKSSEKALQYIYQKHYDFFSSNNMGIEHLFKSIKYKNKYNNLWYRKIFYTLKSLFN